MYIYSTYGIYKLKKKIKKTFKNINKIYKNRTNKPIQNIQLDKKNENNDSFDKTKNIIIEISDETNGADNTEQHTKIYSDNDEKTVEIINDYYK